MLKVIVTVIIAIPTLLFVGFILSAPFAWLAMLLLGVLHSHDPSFPALGFITTWLLVFILRVATIQNVTKTPTTKRVSHSL